MKCYHWLQVFKKTSLVWGLIMIQSCQPAKIQCKHSWFALSTFSLFGNASVTRLFQSALSFTKVAKGRQHQSLFLKDTYQCCYEVVIWTSCYEVVIWTGRLLLIDRRKAAHLHLKATNHLLPWQANPKANLAELRSLVKALDFSSSYDAHTVQLDQDLSPQLCAKHL